MKWLHTPIRNLIKGLFSTSRGIDRQGKRLHGIKKSSGSSRIVLLRTRRETEILSLFFLKQKFCQIVDLLFLSVAWAVKSAWKYRMGFLLRFMYELSAVVGQNKFGEIKFENKTCVLHLVSNLLLTRMERWGEHLIQYGWHSCPKVLLAEAPGVLHQGRVHRGIEFSPNIRLAMYCRQSSIAQYYV